MKLTADQARQLTYNFNDPIIVDEIVDFILKWVKINAIQGSDRVKFSFNEIVKKYHMQILII